MGSVYGWRAVRGGGLANWDDEISVDGEDGENLSPNFLQPLLENFHRRSCNDGSRELIAMFQNPHRKCRSSPSVVARIMQHFVKVPYRAATSGKEEKMMLV